MKVVWLLVVVVPPAVWHLLAGRNDLGVPGKAVWLAGIFLLPWIGVLAYMMFALPVWRPAEPRRARTQQAH